MQPHRAPRKREWHLYSGSVVAASLAFIVVLITAPSSTPQVIGLIFAGIVGTFLMTSVDWKSLEIPVHQWTIITAVFALFATAVIMGYPFRPKQLGLVEPLSDK